MTAPADGPGDFQPEADDRADQAVQAEQVALGALLLHDGAIAKIRDRLRPEHFGNGVHARIYGVMLEIVDAGGPLAPITVADRIGADPDFLQAGGVGYLVGLLASVAMVRHVAYYAETIIKASVLRRRAQLDEDEGADLAMPGADIAGILRRYSEQRAALAAELQPAPEREITTAATLAGRDRPDRRFLVQDYIPMAQVTSIGGAGGDGKTLLLQMLQASTSLNRPWLGLPVEQCVSFGIYCEDDNGELHHRLVDIATGMGVDIGDLRSMHWRSAVSDDAELVTFDRDGVVRPTDYWHWTVRQAKRLGARLVALDSLADVFGGDEINRRQVRSFLTLLRKLAVDIDGAVVLSNHPSLAGIANGSGVSGSTAWRNSVRSALYITRESGDDADPDVRILTRTKSNYARAGDSLRIRWSRGYFEAIDAPTTLDRVATSAKADRVFLALLVQTYEAASWVSANRSARNFAPRVFSAHPDREGLGKPTLEAAMHRLMKGARVVVETYGKRTEPRQRLRAA